MKPNIYFGIPILLFLSSCNLDDEERPDSVEETCLETNIYFCPSSAFNDPFGIALTVAWYSGQCTKEVHCTEDSLPQVDAAQGVIDDEFISANWTSTQVEEHEPNNTFSEATPFILKPQSGLSVSGTLNSTSDNKDFIAFIIDGSPTIIVYICDQPDDCIQPFYRGNEIYLELYDANKNLIESTETPLTHDLSHSMSPFVYEGEQYFLSVVARSESVGSIEYKVIITD